MNRVAKEIFLIISVSSLIVSSASEKLGSACTRDDDCEVGQSVCISGVCACKNYYAQHNGTTCLESKLLGHDCLIDEQCSLRVANSMCKEQSCQCSKGFVRFRKHTCLSPARPGDVCYSDVHCQIYNPNSHCDFIISNLFGRCACDEDGNCETLPTPLPDDLPEVEINKDMPESTEFEIAEPQKSEDTHDEVTEDTTTSEETVKTTYSPSTEQIPQQNSQESVEVDSQEPSNDVIESTSESTTQQSEMVQFNFENETKYRKEPNDNENKLRRETTGISLGFPCRHDAQCQTEDINSRCINGICDCAIKNNGTSSCGSKNTGCAPETFQCQSSGICISWFFVCDGKKDCPDGSDERCQGPKCPSLSFRCGGPKGFCISLAAVCDGVNNCPGAEDENFCMPEQRHWTMGCPKYTFQCGNGRCLPQFEFCNAIPKCADGSDEMVNFCRTHYYITDNKARASGEYCPFKCSNGQCRSTAIQCTGRDGCGDNSDEANCTVCRCPNIQ